MLPSLTPFSPHIVITLSGPERKRLRAHARTLTWSGP